MLIEAHRLLVEEQFGCTIASPEIGFGRWSPLLGTLEVLGE